MRKMSEQEKYEARVGRVADLAVAYLESDKGYYEMRNALNGLMKFSGANDAGNCFREQIIASRRVVAIDVVKATMAKLQRDDCDWLREQLLEIADDIASPVDRRNAAHGSSSLSHII